MFSLKMTAKLWPKLMTIKVTALNKSHPLVTDSFLVIMLFKRNKVWQNQVPRQTTPGPRASGPVHLRALGDGQRLLRLVWIRKQFLLVTDERSQKHHEYCKCRRFVTVSLMLKSLLAAVQILQWSSSTAQVYLYFQLLCYNVILNEWTKVTWRRVRGETGGGVSARWRWAPPPAGQRWLPEWGGGKRLQETERERGEDQRLRPDHRVDLMVQRVNWPAVQRLRALPKEPAGETGSKKEVWLSERWDVFCYSLATRVNVFSVDEKVKYNSLNISFLSTVIRLSGSMVVCVTLIFIFVECELNIYKSCYT